MENSEKVKLENTTQLKSDVPEELHKLEDNVKELATDAFKLNINMDIDEITSSLHAKQEDSDAAIERKKSIQQCANTLMHASYCSGKICRLSNCQRMKRVVSHTKVCKRKINRGCPVCKQLLALSCYHAKNCSEAECPLPYCSNIKYKMKQQQLQKRLKQAELMRRRISTPTTDGRGTGNVPPMAAGPATVGPPAIASEDMLAIAEALDGLKLLHQPDITENGQAHAGVSGSQLAQGNVPRLAVGSAGGVLEAVGLLQSPNQPDIIHSGLEQGENPLHQANVMGEAGIAGYELHNQKQALRELLRVLRLPQSPEQQQQVLAILKSNPKLMAAFIKHRMDREQHENHM